MRSKLEGGGMGRYQELQDERSVEETQPWPQSRPQDQCPPLPELPFPSTSLLLLFCRCFILQREKKSFYLYFLNNFLPSELNYVFIINHLLIKMSECFKYLILLVVALYYYECPIIKSYILLVCQQSRS